MRAETFVGLWGFPGAIDRLAGTLETYPDQMAKLTLAGSLRSTMDFNSEERYPVIHGLTPEGKLITLLDSVEVQYTASLMHGYPTQQLGTQLVFVGGLFSSPDYVLVGEAYVETSRLGDWLGDVGLRSRVGNPDNPEEVAIYLERVSLPAVTIGDAVFSFGRGWGTSGIGNQLGQLTVSPAVNIAFAHPVRLRDVLDRWVAPLVNFLTLATGVPCALERIQIRSDKAETHNPTDRVDVLVPMKQTPDPKPGRRLIPPDMLFSRQQIGEDLESVMRGWYRASDELQDVAGRYFGTRYGQTYVDTRFIALAQAVEILHRRQHPGGVVSKEESRRRVSEIVASAPEAFQAWLRGKLEWSNEPTLRERLSDLLAAMPAVVAPIADDRAAFINLVTDTRNHMTHSDPRLKTKAAAGADLYWLNERLGVVIQAGLLMAVGLTQERVAELFRQNTLYQHLTTLPLRSPT